MKYTFVGDIHGKVEEVERALDGDGHKVFVGDFLDSFDRKPEEQVEALLLALDAADRGEATVLFGNHELSYLMPERHRCSGFKPLTYRLVRPIAGRMMKTMVPYLRLPDNFLVTHAGADRLVLPHVREGEFEKMDTPLHWIGHTRGGRNSVGGIFWLDFMLEFEPIAGVNQIFGHTARAGKSGIATRHIEGSRNYCVDCLDHKREFLNLEL